MSKLPISEADLQAYVDGVLPEARHADIEAYLAALPIEAERLRAYHEQIAALRALFNPVQEEPIPARLQEAAAPRTTFTFFTRAIAAGIVVALVGGMAGWMLRGVIQPPMMIAQAPGTVLSPTGEITNLPRQAAIAHAVYSPEVRRPVEIGVDQEDQLVAWLSKRLGARVEPPKLGALGYELIGGRLLPGTSGPVAQFMYHDVSGHRLTLYVSTENAVNRDTGFRFAQEGSVNVFYWINGKFGYALSASIDKGELARIATAVYDQLEPR